MDSKENGWAVITGASGGIGLELARLIAGDGKNLVLIARNAERLEEVKKELEAKCGVSVKTIPKDLSHPEAPEEIYTRLSEEGAHVDMLVNNAGIGVYGKFSDTKTSRMLGMLQLNIVSLTHLTRLFLPGMIERKSGRILNVASTAAFQPGPLLAVYYATKSYVVSLSEAIAQELAGTGVTVTSLCPGPTATNFVEEADMGMPILFKYGLVMDSQSVARVGYAAMMEGKTLAIAGFLNRLLAFSTRFTPRRLLTKLSGLLLKQTG